jgi:hypothetical protein
MSQSTLFTKLGVCAIHILVTDMAPFSDEPDPYKQIALEASLFTKLWHLVRATSPPVVQRRRTDAFPPVYLRTAIDAEVLS